jgi:hypothetical protein
MYINFFMGFIVILHLLSSNLDKITNMYNLLYLQVKAYYIVHKMLLQSNFYKILKFITGDVIK